MKHNRIMSFFLAFIMLFTLIHFAAFAEGETNFPDNYFRVYISKFDHDEDDFLDSEEIAQIKNIELKYSSNVKYKSFTGIEYLTNLESFICRADCEPVSIDFGANSALKEIVFQSGALTAIEVESGGERRLVGRRHAQSQTRIPRLRIRRYFGGRKQESAFAVYRNIRFGRYFSRSFRQPRNT